MIRIVILASGYSRRMGTDKLSASFSGKPLVQWVIEAAKKTGIQGIHVIYRKPEIADIAKHFGVDALYNPWAFQGQSASVRLAAESLLPAQPILFVPGDQPLLTAETLIRMMNRFEECKPDILCASWNGKRTMPALFSQRLMRPLMTLEGDSGGRQLIDSGQYHVDYMALACEAEQWDIDTDEDMQRFENICNRE